MTSNDELVQSLDPPAIEIIDPLEAEVKKAIARRQLDFYAPYAKQREFHATGAMKIGTDGSLMEERLLLAGNQLGKCATISSYIEHPDGSRSTFGERYDAGVPFDVWGWTGSQLVPTRAITPIRKPAEPCVRLWFSDGRWFECARNHRMLTSSGEYVFCEQLLASLPILPESSVEFSQLTRAEGARRWFRRRRDFLVDCLARLRLCDAQLHHASGIVRSWLRQPVGVREYNSFSYAVGAWSSKYTNSLQSVCARHSNQDGASHLEARCVGWQDRVVYTCAQHMRRYIQAAQRRTLAWILPLRLTASTSPDQSSTEASVAPFSIDGNRIVAYEYIPSQEVYDFTVPETSNYVTCGIVHHNTLCAGGETAMHVTGLYPKDWNGRRFVNPVSCWVSGPTSQMTRDNPQKMLMGEPEAWGTGMIPGRLILDIKKAIHGVSDAIESVLVRHVPTGGTSRILFKTYDQGRIRWQGSTIDFIWMDEEPPEDIYSEGMVRVQVKKGFIMMTFTPLLGMSAVVERFLKEKPQGSIVVKMGIADAEHYTPEERQRRIMKYPEHEREARANGEPVMGSGRVFPVDHNTLLCQPIQIPAYWPRIAGLDIGWDHPTAGVWLAWDRDSDIIYVYDTYRMREQTPVVHAAAIKARGPWIPMAWPHDGLQHDTGSGKILAQQYRTQGVLMLTNHATHAPLPGKKDGTGGYGLEAGVSEMLQRMQTGRWRVFSTCADWIEEYKLYYRKDGLIVKKGDDLMSASRVALMMLRYAKVRVERQTGPTQAIFQPFDPSMGVLG